jgi:arsenate reductase
MADKKRVLILCTGNSARSQMAEGLLRHDAGDRFSVESAGTKPSTVRPEAIAVMKEVAIDISSHRSKHVDEFIGQEFDYVLTVCDNAKDSCPVFFGTVTRLHHSFDAPAGIEGSEEKRLVEFRRVRDELRAYLKGFPEPESPFGYAPPCFRARDRNPHGPRLRPAAVRQSKMRRLGAKPESPVRRSRMRPAHKPISSVAHRQ